MKTKNEGLETLVLYTESIPGNFHESSRLINDRNLAKFVLCMECSGNYTIVVFRMPVYVRDWVKVNGGRWEG